jgi:hypothetical protein
LAWLSGGRSVHRPDETKNQHFLSRVEQELNALDPAASRIYRFSLVDRETNLVCLDDPRGRNISKNLSIPDLFSYSVINKKTRFNFEDFFGQYESTVRMNTLELLKKPRTSNSDFSKGVLEIFAAKMMNLIRNPYSIKKILNTFGGMLQFHPTNPGFLEDYRAVLAGKKPQQEHLCRELGIDADEYRKWLLVIFMALFRPHPDEINLMEGTFKGLFENPSLQATVYIYEYINEHADKRCLLSDRGYWDPSQEPHVSFSFNLRSDAFIIYTFTDIEKFAGRTVGRSVIDAFNGRLKNVHVTFTENDLAALSSYNRNVIYQCARSVYCSSQSIYMNK